MIVDDLIAARPDRLSDLAQSPVIRVPFRLLGHSDDRLPRGLIPMDSKTTQLFGDWAKAPYPAFTLASRFDEPAALHVLSKTDEAGHESMTLLLLTSVNKTIQAQRCDITRRANGSLQASDQLSVFLYWLLEHCPDAPEMAPYRRMNPNPPIVSREQVEAALLSFLCDRSALTAALNGAPIPDAAPLRERLRQIPDAQLIRPVHEAGGLIHRSVVTVISALTLLNTKNTVLREVTHSLEMQRARARRGRRPLMPWREILVRPFAAKAARRHGGTLHGDGLEQIEWRRGHFKVYTEERPLFGLYSGRYWWQPSLSATRSAPPTYRVTVPAPLSPVPEELHA